MKYIIFFIFFLIIPLSSFSIEPEEVERRLNEKWRWSHYGVEDGIPSGELINILMTQDSTVWIIGRKEASWYDGYKWNLVDISSLDLPALFHSHSWESDGIVIVNKGTAFLVNRNGIVNEFQDINSKYYIEDIIISNGAKYLLINENRDFKLLFSKSKKDTFKFLKLPNTISKKFSYSKILFQDVQESIFLNSKGKLYHVLNENFILLENIDIKSNLDISPPTGNLEKGFFYSVGFPNKNRGTWFNNLKIKRKISELGVMIPNTILDSNLTSIFMFSQYQLMCYHKNQSYLIEEYPSFLKYSRRIVKFGYFIYSISKDGLWIADFSDKNIVSFDLEDNDVIGSNDINDIEFLGTDSLVLASGNGLIFLDENKKDIDSIILQGNSITDIEIIRDSIICSSGGFFKGLKRIFECAVSDRYVEDLQVNIHKIYIDKNKRLWLLTLSDKSFFEGSDCYIVDNGILDSFKIMNGYDNNRVWDMIEDKSGTLWFGTAKGISMFDGQNWKSWDLSETVGSNEVFCLEEDKKGNIWFGVRGFTPGYINSKDTVIIPLEFQNNDLSDAWNIYSDSKDVIWIGTRYGLYSYNNGILSRISEDNGLSANWVWPIKEKDGKLYIGTIGGGLNILNLNEGDTNFPKVFFDEPVTKENSVFLSWRAYSWFGRISHEEIEIRYRIDDEEWSQWSKLRQISFYNLPIGKHKFEVQAKNKFGNFFKEPFFIDFSVPGNIFARPEVIGLMVGLLLIIALTIYVVVIYRRSIIANQLIREQNSKLEILNNTKNKFFSIISHDIKNPISAIMMATQILTNRYEKLSDEKKIEKIRSINKSIERIHLFFENLLRWARSQDSGIKADIQKINIKDVLLNSLEILEMNIKDKNIEIKYDFNEDIKVLADTDMMSTVFRNLVSNAVKYSMKNQIVRIEGRINEENYFISIVDHGIGIPEIDRNKLFDQNANFKTKGTTKEPGTGLGLLLSKEFIQKQNGELTYSPNKPVGSIFTVRLPLASN